MKGDGYQATFDAAGCLVQLEGPNIHWVAKQPQATAGSVSYGTASHGFDKPAVVRRVSDRECSFLYKLDAPAGLSVCLTNRLKQGHGKTIVLERQVDVAGVQQLSVDLTVRLPLWRPLANDAWLPRDNGTRGLLGNRPAVAYQFAGKLPRDGVAIALPLVSQPAADLGGRVTVATDPQFSTLFTRDSIEWTYPKEIGLEGTRERRVVATILHPNSEQETLAAFFREILADLPPGPQWLHDIAMVDFDYMSDGGRGWYADIDALTNKIAREDRQKVFLCLHGWYDWLGRYCFDVKRNRFDESWTAFGNHERVKSPPKTITIGGDKVDGGFAKCVPVRLTLKDLHARLDYAKSRGFRVGLYFADGMVAGKDLPTFNPKHVLAEGGWQGPDTPGPAYCQNPLAPAVREFYLTYADALLREFGGDVDAFVWDETFSVPRGSLGSQAVPGYADRAMMRLVGEVTRKVDNHNREHRREVALLTSDCLGTVPNAAPYALAGHGTFQDTWCQPKAWSYAVFPNYRNTVWSCCWWPVHKWNWIEFGVRNHQSPVVISNGWGDNVGFAEMPSELQQRVLDLFQWRKQRTARLQPFDTLPVQE